MRVVVALVVFLIVVVAALAQQPPTPQPSTQPPNATAPKLGHALDPADVDVLTGKKDAAQYPRPMPQVYIDYPTGESMFNQSVQVGEVAPGSILSSGQFGGRFISTPRFGRTRGHFNHFNRGLSGDIAILTGQSRFSSDTLVYTSQFNGSQFANVSTETRPPFSFFGTQRTGAAPTFFFGNTTPATRFFFPRRNFHITAPGAGFGFTGAGSSPGRRP